MKTKISLIVISLAIVILAFLATITTAKALIPVLPSNRLEKITFIHYKKGFIKPQKTGKDRISNFCYKFLSPGAKWKNLPVNYVIDPDNPSGLSETFITDAISKAAEEWDSYTSSELFGNYSVDYNASWDSSRRDGRNEFVFGNYPEPGVIAVTVIWGNFSGPLSTRKIVEFDVMFDTDYKWGDATVNSSLMDLQNISTHETGHGAGLSDLYNTICSEETMYGYSNYGETKKRDLNYGDISGIRKLYGI